MFVIECGKREIGAECRCCDENIPEFYQLILTLESTKNFSSLLSLVTVKIQNVDKREELIHSCNILIVFDTTVKLKLCDG